MWLATAGRIGRMGSISTYQPRIVVRHTVQTPILRAVAIASASGLLAAIPVAVFVLSGAEWIEAPSSRFLVLPAVAVCPPWWLYWSVLGRPDDTLYAAQLSAVVLALNGLLFAPLGVVHTLVLEFGPVVRRVLVGISLVFLLALAHAFFMSEPAVLGSLLRHLAA